MVVQAVASFENSLSNQIQHVDSEFFEIFAVSVFAVNVSVVGNIGNIEVKETLSSRSLQDNQFSHSVLIEFLKFVGSTNQLSDKTSWLI